MKVHVTLKDPDGVYESVRESVEAAVKEIDGLSESEREVVLERRLEEVNEKLGKWIRWGEYLDVEFDIEAGTAIVMPAGNY